ncbi:hypothetical protein B0H34DRAFT_284947 [Crassisporium funariophilum]|nr:hypothetical protein B0H34DRAFT_284947 [Crassisporium funariophilum]
MSPFSIPMSVHTGSASFEMMQTGRSKLSTYPPSQHGTQRFRIEVDYKEKQTSVIPRYFGSKSVFWKSLKMAKLLQYQKSANLTCISMMGLSMGLTMQAVRIKGTPTYRWSERGLYLHLSHSREATFANCPDLSREESNIYYQDKIAHLITLNKARSERASKKARKLSKKGICDGMLVG